MAASRGWEDCYELWGVDDWEKFCRTQKTYWPGMPENTAILPPPTNYGPYRNSMFTEQPPRQRPPIGLTWTLKISRCAGLEQLRVREGNYYCNTGAFQDMLDLRSVLFLGNVVLSEDCFQNCPRISTLYVKGDARILDKVDERVTVHVMGNVYVGRGGVAGTMPPNVFKTYCSRNVGNAAHSRGRDLAMTRFTMPPTMCSPSVRLPDMRVSQHRDMKVYLKMQRDIDMKWERARAARKRQRTEMGRGADTEKRDAKQPRTKVDSKDLSGFYGYNPFDTGTNDIFDQNLNPFLRLRF